MRRRKGLCPVTGKIRWADSIAAGRALGRAANAVNRATTKREQRAYECQWCHAWHLTSAPKRD